MSFNNQPETGIGVKKANQIEYISKDEWEARIKAIAQSKRDIVWWAEQFFHIITLDKGLTKIKLYDKQKGLLKHITDNNRIVTLASRQTGKSTTYTIFCLWYATLFADKKIMICANKLATAIEIMDRIRKAYENLPFYIKPGILTYNKGAIEFANGSSIRACSTSSSASRGSSCNCVIGNTKVTIKDDLGNIFNCNIEDVEKIIAYQQINECSKFLYIDE